MKKCSKIILSILTVISVIGICNLSNSYAAGGLKVHYIDVGSGDAIYLECDGKNMLIDGGYLTQADRKADVALKNDLDRFLHPDSEPDIPEGDADPETKVSSLSLDSLSDFRTLLTHNDNSDITKYLDSIGVKNINYIVSSHPHFDHLGGLIQVINKYTYDHIYYNGRDYSTKYFKYFKQIAADNNTSGKVSAVLQIPQAGETFQLGGAKVTILSDQTTDYSTISGNGDADNNGSLVIKVEYGKRSFLFTGDIQVAAQKQLIQKNASDIKDIDVLKVPHHGHTNNDFNVSSHSGNYEFFCKVNPAISIVECGTKNTSDTIPTPKVKKDLALSDLYTTKDQGNIVLNCDGTQIDVKYKKTTKHSFVKGDVNGSGKVDAADYLMTMDNLLGKYKMKTIQIRTGDVNNSKKIDAADYLMIMDNLLGKIKF